MAKDCPKISQRMAESSLGVNEDLNKQAKNAGNGVFTTRFASAEGKSSVFIDHSVKVKIVETSIAHRGL